MKLDTHIVKKLLMDENFPAEVIMALDESRGQLINSDGEIDIEQYADMAHLLRNKENKNYYITKSVTEHLELFDTKKCMSAEGWKIFKNLPNFKKTYILPEMEPSYAKYGGSGCLRVLKSDNYIQFFHVTCKFLPPQERTRTCDSSMYFVILYVNLKNDELCGHFSSEDGKSLAPFLYSLLCFIELCDNQVVEIQPKQKYGTQKSGKIINILPFPITVVTNTWNVKTIRSEGFPVRGHAALRWTGPNRSVPKMVYIEPYKKEGYTRRSGKELDESKMINVH